MLMLMFMNHDDDDEARAGESCERISCIFFLLSDFRSPLLLSSCPLIPCYAFRSIHDNDDLSPATHHATFSIIIVMSIHNRQPHLPNIFSGYVI